MMLLRDNTGTLSPVKIMLCILLFCFFPLTLQGAGQRETRLDQARLLMDQQRYSEAMTLLQEIMLSDEDNYPEALDMVNEIMDTISQFNNKYETLIKVLYEEEDISKGLELISEMKDIYPYPNEAIVKTIDIAEDSASAVANAAEFNRLMDEAAALVKEQKYTEAVELYLTGFTPSGAVDFHKKDFDLLELGNIIKTPVYNAIIQAVTDSEDLVDLMILAGDKGDSFKESLNARKEGEEAMNSLLASYINLEELNRKIKESYTVLDKQFENLRVKLESEGTAYSLAVNYLIYTRQFLDGRPSSKAPEGILHMGNYLIQEQSGEIYNKIKALGDSFSVTGEEEYTREAYDEAVAALEEAFSYYVLNSRLGWFLDKGEIIPPEETISNTGGGWTVDPSQSHYIEPLVDARSTLARITLTGYLKKISLLEAQGDNQGIESLKLEMRQVLDGVDLIVQAWQDYGIFVEGNFENPGLRGKDQPILELSGFVSSRFLVALARKAEDVNRGIENRITGERELFVSGIYDGTGLPRFWPGLRLEAYRILAGEIDTLESQVEEAAGTWLEDREKQTVHEKLEEVTRRFSVLKEKMAAERRLLEDYILQAEEAVRMAVRYKEEGNLRYDQAASAFRRRDYNQARRRIEEAAEAYDKSLEHQENPEVRQKRNVSLLALSQQIIAAENDLVINEVRRMITQGIDYYNRELYNEAYITFKTAENRWLDTQPEKNDEIDSWLGYVTSALNIKSTREILPTNPLFETMTQLYNYAKENYQEGKRLYQSGRVEEGKLIFLKAIDKIQQIKVNFPYNRDAGVLLLLINKEISPLEFESDLRKRVKEAEEKLRSGERTKQSAGYSELKNLLEVKHGDREIEALIYEAEYRILKIKKEKPKAEDIRKSSELTAGAKRLIDTGIPENIKLAINDLNQAILFNPDNQQAIQLKDKVLGTQAPPGSTLSTADKGNLNKALEYFRRREYLLAGELVDQLWTNPANRSDSKLRDLKEKVDANR